MPYVRKAYNNYTCICPMCAKHIIIIHVYALCAQSKSVNIHAHCIHVYIGVYCIYISIYSFQHQSNNISAHLKRILVIYIYTINIYLYKFFITYMVYI